MSVSSNVLTVYMALSCVIMGARDLLKRVIMSSHTGGEEVKKMDFILR